MKNPYDAYQIAVSYGSDADTTIINLKIMTFDRAVIGHEFMTPSHDIDLFIHLVRQAVTGVGSAGDLNDGSFLSIQRRGEWIIFDTSRTTPIMMAVSIATVMADELDAVQDAINTFLDADVRFSLSGDTPTPEALVADDERIHVW
jgi:hypothetical protein